MRPGIGFAGWNRVEQGSMVAAPVNDMGTAKEGFVFKVTQKIVLYYCFSPLYLMCSFRLM